MTHQRCICSDLKNLFLGVLVLLFILFLGGYGYRATLQRTMDAERFAESQLLFLALRQYQGDHDGALPFGLDDSDDTLQMISIVSQGCSFRCDRLGFNTEYLCFELDDALVPKYLTALPQDPRHEGELHTGYYVNRTLAGKLLVGACFSETQERIEVAH